MHRDSREPDFLASAVTTFNQTFGIPAASISKVLVDGTSPGIDVDEAETLLDLEWSHALAPGAAQVFYLGDNNHAATGISIVDALQRAVADRSCSVISVGFALRCYLRVGLRTGGVGHQ